MPAAMLARGISVLALIATCVVAAEAQTDPGSRIPDPARAFVDKTGVFFDSLALLGIEHGIRLGEPRARRGVCGDLQLSVRSRTDQRSVDRQRGPAAGDNRLRLVFNPTRAMSNTAAGHLPWYRPDRSLSW